MFGMAQVLFHSPTLDAMTPSAPVPVFSSGVPSSAPFYRLAELLGTEHGSLPVNLRGSFCLTIPGK